MNYANNLEDAMQNSFEYLKKIAQKFAVEIN
jgi:hypothetical protein